ncbi:MAG TPA: sigma-E factor regulatory protein RseB domain-containing protein, partial [Armatimonadota bacterium]|nr:sigma-E factor regulatory protein RseB domain-containing protein [Armatimonadota bacterium]
MSRRVKLLVGVAALALLGGGAYATWQWRGGASDPRAVELMRHAMRSLHETPVQGVVVTRVRTPDGWKEARADVHRGEGRARVHYLTGPATGTTVIRQGGRVWSVGPGDEPEHLSLLAGGPGERLTGEALHRNYRVRIAGTEQIAGRPATIISATGRFGSQRLAIDDQTHFPLLMERYDARGELRASTVYERADFAVQPPPRQEPPQRAQGPADEGTRFSSIQELKAKVRFTLYQPSYLPKGFQLQDARLRGDQRGQFATVRYSDGMRTILVIQTDSSQPPMPRSPRGPEGGRTREPRGEHRGERGEHGPRHLTHMRGAGTDAIRRDMDGTRVIVVGGIPRNELARV